MVVKWLQSFVQGSLRPMLLPSPSPGQQRLVCLPWGGGATSQGSKGNKDDGTLNHMAFAEDLPMKIWNG